MEATQGIQSSTVTFNVGGTSFTYATSTISKIGELCPTNILSLMSNGQWNSKELYLEVEPALFTDWFDSYIRHGFLPVKTAIKCDQLMQRILSTASYLGFESIIDHLTPTPIPEMAFGPEQWEEYFGDVGEVPPLPKKIEKILASDCPHFPGKKVSETHMLTLIPATVDGNPFTLNRLGELVKSPKKGSATKYEYYWEKIHDHIGNKAPEKSCWLLMTKDVLYGSRCGGRDYMLKMAADKIDYEAPTVLGAATSVLLRYVCSGERLLSDDPWTLTCCLEQKEGYKFVVGGFGSSGLRVGSVNDCSAVGVASARKFL